VFSIGDGRVGGKLFTKRASVGHRGAKVKRGELILTARHGIESFWGGGNTSNTRLAEHQKNVGVSGDVKKQIAFLGRDPIVHSPSVGSTVLI